MSEMRSHDFRHKCAWRDTMSPSQTIEVAGQAFTPDRFHATWHQPIEPAARWDIECLEPVVPFRISHCRSRDFDFNHGSSSLVYPAFFSSSPKGCNPPPSRPVGGGVRPPPPFSCLRFLVVDGGCLFFSWCCSC